jgi:hypothetical protein
MAKKSRATFQKREKERARQQKQKDKAQRRLELKERRASGELPDDEEDVEMLDLPPQPQVSSA